MFGIMKDIEAKSAGTSYAATVVVTRELTQWADIIFVMEQKHEQALVRIDPSSFNKIRVLDVPDMFQRDQPELTELLRERMRPYLAELCSI